MADETHDTVPTLSAEGEDTGGPAGQTEATVADTEKESQNWGFMSRLFRPFTTPKNSDRTDGGPSGDVPAPRSVKRSAGAEAGGRSVSQGEGQSPM